jgi:ribosomal protein S27E
MVFIIVKCKCNNNQITNDTSTIMVKCKICKRILTFPQGGKCIINGRIIEKLW